MDSEGTAGPIAHPGYEHEGRVYVRPGETDELLINPGMGFCTYQRFNGDPTEEENRWNDDGPTEYSRCPGRLKNEGYPDTSVAYLRWYWARLEPEKGMYRWDIVDRALEEAGKRQQQLHVRFMPHDSTDLVPEWYKKEGRLIEYTKNGRACCIPVYEDPLFRRATETLVGLLGERYDGHPLLCAADIGTLGYWGEWHNSGVPGNPMGNEALRRWAADLYFEAFPRTPLLMLIAPQDTLAYATAKGAGWRADCWGDMRPEWCHMFDRYPGTLCRERATNAWKRAPVCLETCWTFVHWHNRQWDVDYILEEALRWHVSLINAKSSVIPGPWRDKVDAFQKRLGYRYVLRSAAFPRHVQAGQSFLLDQWWVNRGVAPCYVDCRILVSLKGAARNVDRELPHDLRTWLPGEDQCPRDSITLPGDVPPGKYELHVAIVRAGQAVPAVMMANRGRSPSGWLRLGTIEVRAG